MMVVKEPREMSNGERIIQKCMGFVWYATFFASNSKASLIATSLAGICQLFTFLANNSIACTSFRKPAFASTTQ